MAKKKTMDEELTEEAKLATDEKEPTEGFVGTGEDFVATGVSILPTWAEGVACEIRFFDNRTGNAVLIPITAPGLRALQVELRGRT
ncbi:hypothetical protein AMJ39_09495 [candidate division TA06 bacterium DG_24]|uniref:Uncharacterized protein n=1 Tax=candidate division TA06 bacterium DG_24 TaxID=1703770 RepID=A0A0S7WNE0_UNCT6|nr:MAG: hypothetical protein AMJ39_09495 [candidate division TA06 bacterium DG_24]